MTDSQTRLVLTSLPDPAIAQAIAQHVVEHRLAACANILPAMTSIYRWQGNIETASESALWLKTSAAQVDALMRAVLALHPYEVPEMIVIPIVQGLPAYLNWINTETGPDVPKNA